MDRREAVGSNVIGSGSDSITGLSLEGLWMKLTRSGNTYHCYYRENENDTWIEFGTPLTFAMNTQSYFCVSEYFYVETNTFKDVSLAN